MAASVLIRQAASPDIPTLLKLLELLFSIEKDFIFNAEKQTKGLELLLGESRAAVLVAVEDGQVIGMCTGQLLISTAEGGLSALVEDVAVVPDWQGKGLGRRLINAVGEWAVRQGASRVQLLADRNNTPAHSLTR